MDDHNNGYPGRVKPKDLKELDPSDDFSFTMTEGCIVAHKITALCIHGVDRYAFELKGQQNLAPILTIRDNGKVEFCKNVDIDVASRRFWEALEHYVPRWRKQMADELDHYKTVNKQLKDEIRRLTLELAQP